MLESKILKNMKNLKKKKIWSNMRSDRKSDMRSDMRSDIKLIICQMSKCQTPGLWRRLTKKKLDIMRLRYDEVNFEVRFDDHQNTTKCS